MKCVRCGRSEQLEEHHIVARVDGGTDEPENKEWRCQPCHKYEHSRRNLMRSIEGYIIHRTGHQVLGESQPDRIAAFQHRLDVLNHLNSVEAIVERGSYIAYWTDASTRELPRNMVRKPTYRGPDEWD